MTVYLVRHARAGNRSKWKKPDHLRPLSKVGRRQAEGLHDVVINDLGQRRKARITNVLSSPYVRCVQTVEPLAEALGLEIELDERLGATRLHEVEEVLERLRGEHVAVCTHGDLPWLGDRKFKKGATWVVDDELVPSRYIEPQA